MEGPTGSVCEGCGSLSFNAAWYKAFGVLRCLSCSKDDKLISKAVAKSTFLVNDADLAKLGCITKPNPTHRDFNPMKLYLASQVQRLAERRHGSMEAIEELRHERIEHKLEDKAAKRKREQRLAEREQKHLGRIRERVAAQAEALAQPAQQEAVEDFEDPESGRKQRRYAPSLAATEIEEI